MRIRSILKKELINRNYFLAKYYYRRRLGKDLGGGQPAVIFQMGKVGSTTILHSLRALNLDMPVYQVHALSAKGIQEMEQLYYGNKPKLLRSSYLPETEHVFTSHIFRRKMCRTNQVNRCRL